MQHCPTLLDVRLKQASSAKAKHIDFKSTQTIQESIKRRSRIAPCQTWRYALHCSNIARVCLCELPSVTSNHVLCSLATMKGLRLALLATVLLACTPSLHAAPLAYHNLDATIAYMIPAASSQPRVVVIGDKLVEDGTKQENGWVSQLKGAYQNSVEVFSLGSNLSNSEGEFCLNDTWHAGTEPGGRTSCHVSCAVCQQWQQLWTV